MTCVLHWAGNLEMKSASKSKEPLCGGVCHRGDATGLRRSSLHPHTSGTPVKPGSNTSLDALSRLVSK